MFNELIQWIKEFWNEVNPFFIVREYQEALLLRNGKFRTLLKAGFHVKLPFLEEYIAQHIVQTTQSLSAQSLVTNDGKNIVVRAMVKYRIVDVKTYLLEVFDAVDAISDVTQGIIKNIIMSKSFEECLDNELDNLITKKCRAEIKKFGVEIMQVTLTDIAPIRSYRLINDTFSSPLN